MTEEETKKFVSELNAVLAHIDQLTDELHTHVDFIEEMFANFVDVVNK